MSSLSSCHLVVSLSVASLLWFCIGKEHMHTNRDCGSLRVTLTQSVGERERER